MGPWDEAYMAGFDSRLSVLLGGITSTGSSWHSWEVDSGVQTQA